MENKQSYNLNVVFAKRKYIKNTFAKNTIDSITHLLVLMLLGCGSTGTAAAAALWVSGGAGCKDLVAAYMQALNNGEGSGNSLNDSSGNGNDGSIYGTIWITGKFGSALNFDESDDGNKYRGIKL